MVKGCTFEFPHYYVCEFRRYTRCKFYVFVYVEANFYVPL